MSPKALDRLFTEFEPDRRDFLRRVLVGAAWAVPLVGSFSLDGLGVAPLEAQASNLLCSNIVTRPDLVIAKTADRAQALLGETVVFTLTVSNCAAGPVSDAANAIISDPLPPEFAFQAIAHLSGPAPNGIATPAAGTNGTVTISYLIFPGYSTAVFELTTKVIG